jgi:hypothetical protein
LVETVNHRKVPGTNESVLTALRLYGIRTRLYQK